MTCRTGLRVALALALGVPAGAARAQARPETSDSARLQGTWRMVTASANGMALPPQYVSAMQRVLDGRDLNVTMDGQTYFRATIMLDTTVTPRAIDYQMTAGPSAGATQLGIYALAGDTVRFCFAAPGTSRPMDFSTKAGDGRTFSMWVRTEP